MFVKVSWLDQRTTSGDWRVAKDFAGLPAWIVKAVGGSTVHWAGASLRIQEDEFKARTHYGDVPGASLLDWPISLGDLEPYYDKAEDRMGVTRTHGVPVRAGAGPVGLPAQVPVSIRRCFPAVLPSKRCGIAYVSSSEGPRKKEKPRLAQRGYLRRPSRWIRVR